MFSFDNMILHTSPRVREGRSIFDADVRKEGVLVEENRAARKVGHVKSFMKNFVFDILRSLLQGNDMLLSSHLFLDSIFLSTSGPRIPVVNAEPPLHR